MGEFYVANKISVNTTVTGWIQDGAKPFASVKGGKKHCILYTVYYNLRFFLGK